MKTVIIDLLIKKLPQLCHSAFRCQLLILPNGKPYKPWIKGGKKILKKTWLKCCWSFSFAKLMQNCSKLTTSSPQNRRQWAQSTTQILTLKGKGLGLGPSIYMLKNSWHKTGRYDTKAMRLQETPQQHFESNTKRSMVITLWACSQSSRPSPWS